MLTKAVDALVTGDNWVQNDTDIKNFEIIVNGKEPAN